MSFLRRLSIRARVVALVFICLTGIIAISADSLHRLNSSILDAKKESVRLQTDSAYSIVKELYELSEKGKMNTQQAQALAKQTLASMRYDGNYFFISHITGVNVMHPIKPRFYGENLSGLKDPNGVALVQDILSVAQNDEKGGFTYYQWPKTKDSELIDKLSYSVLFKPWDWIISTGVYIDDIQEKFYIAAMQTAFLISILITFILLVAWFILRTPADD